VLRYGRFFMILDSQHISIGAPGSFNRIEPNTDDTRRTPVEIQFSEILLLTVEFN
jgi:hypothetical protein